MHVFKNYDVSQIQSTFTVAEFEYLNENVKESLKNTLEIIFSAGKGLLIADESLESIGHIFVEINLENNEENRINYRKLLLCEDIKNYVSCVIFHKEALDQIEDLLQFGIIVGVKADKGVCERTIGLDDIKERCCIYAEKGCKVTKWRCVFNVSENTPSYHSVIENCNNVARYASASQSYSMVPIIDINIKAAGKEDLKILEEVTENLLCLLFKSLNDHHVFLEGVVLILRPIRCGKSCRHETQLCDEIAAATFAAFNRAIPPALGGIIFADETLPVCETSICLNNLIRYVTRKPWPFTFAMGRNFAKPIISIWKGNPDLVDKAQKELIKRLDLFSFALFESSGSESSESPSNFKDFIKNHAYG